MGARALSHMFGGLADFLKLERGMQQETKDRALAKERHDQQILLGTKQGEAMDVGTSYQRAMLDFLPRAQQLQIIQGMHPIVGATGIGGFIDNKVWSPTEQTSLGTGIGTAIAREGRNDALQNYNLSNARRADTEGTLIEGIRGDIRGKIAAGTFDPTKSSSDLFNATQAGWGVMGTPTWDAQQLARKEEQNRAFEHSKIIAGMNISAARQLIQDQLPPGTSLSTGRMLADDLKQVHQDADLIRGQIMALDTRIMQEQDNIHRLSGYNPSGNQAAIQASTQVMERLMRDRRVTTDQFKMAVEAIGNRYLHDTPELKGHPGTVTWINDQLNLAISKIPDSPPAGAGTGGPGAGAPGSPTRRGGP